MGTSEAQLKAAAKAYSLVLNQALGVDRRRYILVACLIWLIPVLVLYAIGEAVAWVRKGFSSSNAP